MLLLDKKLLFIHIPKCAGTSIEVFFTGRDWTEINPRTKHLTAQEAVRTYGREVWDQCFTFSVVRNPWGRLLSFFNLVRTAEPKVVFDDWIRQVCSPQGLDFMGVPVHLSMTEYLSGPDGKLMVEFVGKFESLSEDFRVIAERAGCSSGELPRHMVSPKYDRNYRKWYTPVTRDLVGQRFREDVERFGYDY